MKRLFLLTAILLFSVAIESHAALINWGTQTIDVNGTESWADGILEVEVLFDDSTGNWTYNYEFNVPAKGISHLIIELTDDDPATQENEAFTNANLLPGTTPGGSIDFYSDAMGSSNPGLSPGFYGIKWDTDGDDVLLFSSTIVTDRAPMIGDFYSKDGRENSNDVWAWVQDGVWVPDTHTTPIPEPASMLLVGGGLIGLAGFGRKKIFKK